METDEQRAREYRQRYSVLGWNDDSVAAYASEREQAARTAAVEECAKVICKLCELYGAPDTNGKHTLHYVATHELPAHDSHLPCKAAAIRALAPAASYCCGDPNCRGHLVGEPAASKEAEPGNG